MQLEAAAGTKGKNWLLRGYSAACVLLRGPSRLAGVGPGSGETIPSSRSCSQPRPRHLPTLWESSGFPGTHTLGPSAVQTAAWVVWEGGEDRGILSSWEELGALTP